MLFVDVMSRKRKLVLIIGLGLSGLLFAFLISNKTQDDFSTRAKIVIREVGNQLLLKNNDSTSLILPVIQKETGIFQLSFNDTLGFKPNHLVDATTASFAKSNFPTNYTVAVIECTQGEVSYSYQMTNTEETTIVPCSGRALPAGCYTITFTMPSVARQMPNSKWLILLAVLAVFLLLDFRLKKQEQNAQELPKSQGFSTIGSYKFYPTENKLVKAAHEISLSKKECELLAIFIANPNKVIKRDELTKKVWEDNGVYVGRSLDTYVSKLRKILKDDKHIKITNVHGVGYKLEVNT